MPRVRTIPSSLGFVAVSIASLTASVTLAQDEAPPSTRPAESAKAIRVRVIDASTKQPIATARVGLDWVGPQDVQYTPVDAGGVATIRPPVGPSSFLISAISDGKVPLRRILQGEKGAPPALPDEITFALEAGETWGGTVVDAEGKAAGGATVQLFLPTPAPKPGDFQVDIVFRTVTADADGRWTFSGMPADAKGLQLAAFHLQRGGTSRGFTELQQISDADAAKLRAGSFVSTLTPAQLVTGRVTDADGKPIANASVGPGQDRVASNVLPPTKTDADGRYAIGATPGETLVLTFAAPGFAPDILKLTPQALAQPADVKLAPAKTIAGRVVDPDGKPIAKAFVFLDTWRGARTLSQMVQADDDGRFEVRDAPADAVEADVMQDGFARARNTPLVAGQANVVTLNRPVTFHGTVIDADTKEPIASYKVITGLKFSEGEAVSFQRSEAKAESNGNTFTRSFTFPYPFFVVRVEAKDYAPLDSTPFTMKDVDPSFTFALHKAAGVSGTIQTPDGKPAAGVTVVAATERALLFVENGRVPSYAVRDQVSATTDDAGRFDLPPATGAYVLYASSDAGWAQITESDVKAAKPIALRPFAKVSGDAFIGTKPATNATITGQIDVGAGNGPRVYQTLKAKTDEAGHFELPRVPGGTWSVGREVALSANTTTITAAERLTLADGEAKTIRLGNVGRSVTGRVQIPAELAGRKDWAFGGVMLMEKPRPIATSRPTVPTKVLSMSLEDRKAFAQTDEGKALQAKFDAYNAEEAKANEGLKRYAAAVNADGTFRLDDVLPGTYTLSGDLQQPPDRAHPPIGERIGALRASDVVVTAGDADQPFEISDVTVIVKKTVAVGQPAPDFDVPTLDGERVKLSSLRGKFVLLDFWATWCGPCIAETPDLKATWDRFGRDDRFAMISLSLDETEQAPRDYAAKEKLGWTQAYVGPFDHAPAAQAYGVEGIPDVMLVGPDGKLLARGLRGPAISEAIAKALDAAK